MKFLRIALVAVLALCTLHADANFRRGTGTGVHGWNPVLTGAGGQVLTVNQPTASSPLLMGTDTGGAYTLRGSQWYQLVTTASMPAAFRTNILTGAPFATLGAMNMLSGVWDIQSAPNDPTRCYMAYSPVSDNTFGNGHIFVSNNCNAADATTITWANTASDFFTATGGTWDSNSHPSSLATGNKIGVDPANKDVLYVSSIQSGQFMTSDGGASWVTVPSVPASTFISSNSPVAATGWAFDTSSGTISTGSVGGHTNITRTAVVWVCNQNGVWRSADGGATWTKLTAGVGPTNVSRGKIGSDGTYYATEYNLSKLWRYNVTAATWVDITPTGAVGSGNAYTMVTSATLPGTVTLIGQKGNAYFATNANSVAQPSINWAGSNSNPTRTSADIPWLLQPPSPAIQDFLSIGDAIYDPSNPNKIWSSNGVGAGYTTSTSVPISYNYISAGMQQLVGLKVISPPGGSPVMSFWDRAVFKITNPAVYSSGYGPNYTQNQIEFGWGIDYARDNSNFIVMHGNANGSGSDSSSYSLDGGANWSLFTNFVPNPGLAYTGGQIAVSNAGATPISTAHIVYTNSNAGDVYNTKNTGTTPWTRIDGPTKFTTNGTLSSGVRNAVTSHTNTMAATAAASASGGTQTAFTVAATGVSNQAGVSITITGATNAGYNGTWTVQSGTATTLTLNVAFIANETAATLSDTIDPGWGFNGHSDRQGLCADRMTSDTFYIYNSQPPALGGAFYRSTDGGDNWIKQSGPFTGSSNTGGLVNQIHCVPGQAGGVFYTAGQPGSNLFYTANGGSAWTAAITGSQGALTDVFSVGTGLTKPGNNFPSVFVIASVAGKWGVWQSDNSQTDWAAGTNISWTYLGLPSQQGFDWFTTISGDNNTYGVVYLCGKAVSCSYYTP